MSEFERKYDRANEECFKNGAWGFRDGKPINWESPIWRFTSFTKMRHPLYQSFLFNFLTMFAYLFPIVLLARLVLSRNFSLFAGTEAYSEAATTAIMFASLFSIFHSWQRRQKKLSRWEDL